MNDHRLNDLIGISYNEACLIRAISTDEAVHSSTIWDRANGPDKSQRVILSRLKTKGYIERVPETKRGWYRLTAVGLDVDYALRAFIARLEERKLRRFG